MTDGQAGPVTSPRERARALARGAIQRGDPTSWFEPLYAEADGDPTAIQWADLTPNSALVAWLDGLPDPLNGRRALVVGCGLGDDAEELARRGATVTAFDISPTAVDWCRRRFPESSVRYVVADLLEPPEAWHAAFDLVIEIYTLQVLPPGPRGRAAEQLAQLLAPSGRLLVIARARALDESAGEMPWPLTRDELHQFSALGLREVSIREFVERAAPPVRRFLAEFAADESRRRSSVARHDGHESAQ